MWREALDVLQQRLAQVGADLKGAAQLRRRQLQQNLERLRLAALAALNEALPHLLLRPHLQAHNRNSLNSSNTPQVPPNRGPLSVMKSTRFSGKTLENDVEV